MPIGESCAVLAAITWAVGSLLIGRVRDVSAGAMNLAKLFVSGALLLLTHLALGGGLSPAGVPSSAGWLLVTSSIIGLTIGDTAYFAAILALGAPRALLMLSSAPVFAVTLGWVALGERLDARALAGVAVTLVGIALVVLGRPGVGGLPVTPRGLAYGGLAGVSQAVGSLLSRRAMLAGIEPLAASAVRLCVGGVALLAFASATGRVRPWMRELRADRAWLRVAAACFLGSYIGLWLAQVALKRASSVGVASTLLATSPAFALPLAHAARIERITGRAALGVVATVAGIALLSIR